MKSVVWRNRIVFLFLWVLSLVGISFFSGPVSYGFFVMLTATPVVSVLYVIYVFFFFRIYQSTEGKNPVAGRLTPFYFTLMNEYLLGFCFVSVSFFSDFSYLTGLDKDAEYVLLPKSGIRKDTGLTCLYRGEYEVGIKSVEIRDYFGLIRLRYKNREPLGVIVRPRLTELDLLDDTQLSKNLPRDIFINKTEPDTLVRNYEYGDDLRQINWKATAHAGELLVRTKTGKQKDGICILMESQRFSDNPSEYLPLENKVIELTLALSLFFAKKNTLSTVCYLGDERFSHDASSMNGFEKLYERLSSVRFSESQTQDRLLDEAMQLRLLFECKSVFFILHKWSARMEELAGLLHAQNVAAVIYLVGDEKVGGDETGKTENADGGEALPVQIPGLYVRRIGTDTDLSDNGKEAGA